MSEKYVCKKCMFSCCNFNDIKRHINKKKPCQKIMDSFNYSDDQLLILTLLSKINITDKIEEELNYLKKSDIITKNKDKLFNDIYMIEKKKLKNCIYCSNEFDKLIDLKKHILVKCFFNQVMDKNNINILNNINNLNNSNNIINITNNNITNIYVKIKSPIPFDSDWDISKIDKINREHLAFSNFMYTKLLEEILKNEINLNVIIDKNNDLGIVYKNDIDRYIQMKSKDIVDNTMDKLKNHLIKINNDSKDSILFECIDIGKKMIENKYDSYINNDIIQKSVKDIISKIFDEKKEEAITISNNFQNEIMKNIDKGF